MTELGENLLPEGMVGNEVTGSRWRTLAEVVSVEEGLKGVLGLRFPGWKPDTVVSVVKQIEDLKPGDFLLAEVNLVAREPEDLKPSDFSLLPPLPEGFDLPE